MKPYLISTALLAVLSGAAVAQDADSLFRAGGDAADLRASEFIGMDVYAAEMAVDATEFDGAQDDWNNIGEINDVIFSRDGVVQAVIVDIGGFLGMGAREVAFDMDAVKFVSDTNTTDDPTDFFLVLMAAQADLEAAPDYVTGATAMTDVSNGQATADQTGAMPAPMMRDGYVQAEVDYLTSERLTGATVFDAEDNSVGSIGDLILDENGQTTHVVVDVGGFLGIGEKPVMLSLADMTILRDGSGDDVRVYVRQTRDELDAMARFEQ